MIPDFPTIDVHQPGQELSISPTDVSQFIRLDQCQRYLRLQLHARRNTQSFLTDYDVAPQSIPPILTKSGADFETTIEKDVGDHFPSVHFSEKTPDSDDNAAVAGLARALDPGQVQVLFQPRLQADLGQWRIRGDVDIIRLERTAGGDLQVLIADMKSSTASKVEHRLQVAFYHEMLASIFAKAGIAHAPIELAILYRGPAEEIEVAPEAERTALLDAQRAEAFRTFGSSVGLLERIEDANAYINSVHDLVIGPTSTAQRVLSTPFEQIPFHLTYKCDGCLYNEFCMKRSSETDDLSLLPHLSEQDKSSLIRNRIATISDLASLKELHKKGQVSVNGDVQENSMLVPATGKEQLAGTLAATWPVGPRLDELIHRAKRYRNWKGDEGEYLGWIPGKGYGTLPYSDATHNPNLVRIFIDVQHDYLNDRVYMLGALLVGNEGGAARAGRRRSVVHLAEGSPDSHEVEERLIVDWVEETLQALVEIAAPDAEGKPKAPIHLIFINNFAQRVLLDALGRHATTILGATALYDFVTQMAAFDSPLSTFLDTQIREQKNYPMVCQSLQSVAAFLRFDWNKGTPYRDLFKARLFDYLGKLDDPDRPDDDPRKLEWYTSRSRFNSQIPLEFAYAAWGELPPPAIGKADDMAAYRVATPDLVRGFHARRLEAMEHVAADFRGNSQTELSSFDLPDLANFREKASTFAQALDEFVAIERHVELAGWKNERLAAPEQRLLSGQTLIVRYLEEDQEPGIAEENLENQRKSGLNKTYRAAYKEANPTKSKVYLSKEQKAESDWSQEGTTFRLRLETESLACDLDKALALTTLKEGSRLVLSPRFTVDSRRSLAEQVSFTPTPKQMLYGMRADLTRIVVDRDTEGRATRAIAEVVMQRPPSGGAWSRGFVFGGNNEPLQPGALYTLDDDPNSYNGYWAAKVTEGLVTGGENTLHNVLTGVRRAGPTWSVASDAGQQRFLAGLDALREARALHGFEPSKREFIGDHGATPLLLVQGPPGTGKSYSTAFALFARIQGAMAGGRDFRVFLSCKTHAATDVLLRNVRDVQDDLVRYARSHPSIFATYFDSRLLDIPLFRLRPRGEVHPGITPLGKDEKGQPKAVDTIAATQWSVVAGTPGSIYSLIKDHWDTKSLFGHVLAHCLVLDEASQMNIPEAVMAALPLGPDGTLIVVGDHRQMPPIVKNDWNNEPRRTFQEFRSYESLFLSLLALKPAMIKFEESFRLHADMAEFLRKEIYDQDGINYHSNLHNVIDDLDIADPFVAAVLSSHHPLTIVIHDEAESQVRNSFEQELMTPILSELADPDGYDLKPYEGLGVVVPHRAQRAALQEGVRDLNVYDDETGEVLVSAVDTVERFQGGERTVILIGATESDREYLLVSSKFLLDPRRLTVALSRAKRKLVLVAARSVFEVFSADEETFANAQLWKNLLRNTCTVPLWSGERGGVHVEVWGNQSTRNDPS